MRTTAVLVALLLVVGLNLGASGALAGDIAIIQPLPTGSQPVSDVELYHIRGKFLGWGAHRVSVPFTDFITHDNRVFRRIMYPDYLDVCARHGPPGSPSYVACILAYRDRPDAVLRRLDGLILNSRTIRHR
jgi:hypothetical protein